MNMIQKRQQMRGQSGFTLIELLVAIAILGILAGVAVFAVGNLTDSADTAACQTEQSTIETASAAADATPDATDTITDYLSTTPQLYTTTGTLTSQGTAAGCTPFTL